MVPASTSASVHLQPSRSELSKKDAGSHSVYDVALVGVSDSEVQENLHRIEALAEAAGLKINVAKTKNMGVRKRAGSNHKMAGSSD